MGKMINTPKNWMVTVNQPMGNPAFVDQFRTANMVFNVYLTGS